MSTPQDTDERLRSRLNGNQPGRERMCLAVMALNQQFRNVRPRCPEGGPDGGRDLEATDDRGQTVYGAVGFVNNASDTPSHRKQIQKKFRVDLASARAAYADLRHFAFFTNINLTPGEKDILIVCAQDAGIFDCAIYDRERIRIALDSPNGFHIRFQYLNIPLSEAEQAAFFQKWGTDITLLISNSFLGVERRLQRLEFHQDCLRRLDHLSFVIHPDRPLTRAELPTYRAVMVVTAPTPRPAYQQLFIAIANEEEFPDPERAKADGQVGQFAINEISLDRGTSRGIRPDPMKVVAGFGGFDWLHPAPFATLGDLDDNLFIFYLDINLAKRVSAIEIVANGYRLWQMNRDRLHFGPPTHGVPWPWTLSETDQFDSWVQVTSLHGTIFHFDDFTPAKLYTPRHAPY